MPRSEGGPKLYFSENGEELFNARAAARYLKYHPVSFRRLVSRGEIRPYSRVGFASLYRVEDLDRFRRSSPWAAKKKGGFHLPNPPEESPRERKAKAVVKLKRGRRDMVFRRLLPFRWNMVPAIRTQIERKFGPTPFQISVEMPDGGRFNVSFRPPAQNPKRRSGLKTRKKHGEIWLTG